MELKVGDKVKTVKHFFIEKKAGMIGVIVEIYPKDKEILYRIAVGKKWSCPVYESEIEKVYVKGEQLLLFEL